MKIKMAQCSAVCGKNVKKNAKIGSGSVTKVYQALRALTMRYLKSFLRGLFGVVRMFCVFLRDLPKAHRTLFESSSILLRDRFLDLSSAYRSKKGRRWYEVGREMRWLKSARGVAITV